MNSAPASIAKRAVIASKTVPAPMTTSESLSTIFFRLVISFAACGTEKVTSIPFIPPFTTALAAL